MVGIEFRVEKTSEDILSVNDFEIHLDFFGFCYLFIKL